MAEWFIVDKSTGTITGWQRGGKELPVDTDVAAFVATDEAAIELYEKAKRIASRDVRDPIITLADGVPTLENDGRPVFSLVASETDVALGSAVTLTLTALRADGVTVRSAMSGAWVRDFGGARLMFDFVDGVATRSFTLREPRRMSLMSGRNFRLIAPVHLDVYE